jgi:hypothetical protein
VTFHTGFYGLWRITGRIELVGAKGFQKLSIYTKHNYIMKENCLLQEVRNEDKNLERR